ncbi:DDHD domain-containing protein [Zychaea mexicana]|uniref:DDHD domain-containing protein n=1 Tax=Zychaea mexicana TaxID=64656 RepID=UPI0022FEC57B|nr:DDHD domain-containing protein [Zychaea mexicana]KAI9498558.1 DDHD domain-containing protein [Zychaea mexicana]
MNDLDSPPLANVSNLSHHYAVNRRVARPRSLIPDSDVPNLAVRWFHAIDNPITDPISVRKAKSLSRRSTQTSTSSPSTNSSMGSPKKLPPKEWLPFSKRDSNALEKAYQNNDVRAKVLVNEDHLFEVDVTARTISPVYWEGPIYEVRRATWFIQGDGSKWVPCEESLAEQIELGYYKHKPYLMAEDPITTTTTNPSSTSSLYPEEKQQEDKDDAELQRSATAIEEKKLEISLEQKPVEKQWNLLGPYLGQYIVYTGTNTAWLLYNTAGSKIAKSIITRLTNRSNLGGTRLLRGYPEVEKQSKPKTANSPKTMEQEKAGKENERSIDDITMAQEQVEGYDNEDSEEEMRPIDHLIFVIHGIGQKMSERMGQNFTHDVNVLRKTLKSAYPTAISATNSPQRPNGIQVLPILWRHEITFGVASDDEEGLEMDLGMVGADDGHPTLDELTLEGVPNIRLVVSDVLLDVPLYLTQKYRDQMTSIIIKEINRVYRLFVQRNPEFLEKQGKVTIIGHSLGSLLAFDVLSTQPQMNYSKPTSISLLDDEKSSSSTDKKNSAALLFPVQNFFAVGSPLGVILLLRGYKIASRKCLEADQMNDSAANFGNMSYTPSTISFCYPAVDNLYNIFHKSDPVAYRLEPLIARQYTAKLKPVPIAYIKGGLKSVIDAGFSVGSGIANRAGAMFESVKMGFTTSLFMRGLGLSRQMEEELNQQHQQQQQQSDSVEQKQEDVEQLYSSYRSTPPTPDEHYLRSRSRSDPALAEKYRRRSASMSSGELSGAEKLQMLNKNGRVDFCLQEGILENPYLSAFSAHMTYWQDLDVAAFLVREIYTTNKCT